MCYALYVLALVSKITPSMGGAGQKVGHCWSLSSINICISRQWCNGPRKHTFAVCASKPSQVEMWMEASLADLV